MGRPKIFDREEFLRVTTQLFWKKGFSVSGLAEILSATGVSKSSVYSEFKDKDDIFNQCVKFHRKNLKILAVLESQPQGWGNVEAFLRTPLETAGQKGCFFANSVREYSSIPEAAKREMAQFTQACQDLLAKNIAATKSRRDPEQLAASIMTFSAGVSLKLNAVKPEQLLPEVEMFMELIKR